MESGQCFVQEYRPSRKMRMLLALGFRYSAYAPRPEGDDAHYTISKVITHWDWRDRLRILISGMTEIEVCVETEKLEMVKGSQSGAVVLAPGAFYKSGVSKQAVKA